MAGGFGSKGFQFKVWGYQRPIWICFAGLVQSNGFKELPNGMETGFDVQDYVLKLRYQSIHPLHGFNE